MHPITQAILGAAAISLIVVAALYADEHVICSNFLGFTKACVCP
jgi:hypothetical protein